MLLGVIVLNTAIAIVCFWSAWQLFLFRSTIQSWRISMDASIEELQHSLAQAPLLIGQNRQELRDRREQYSILQSQLDQYLSLTRQVLAVVQWGTSRWRGSGNLSRRVSK